ncbi:MAG TPA: DsbA family protein [Rhodobacteraceae bacterium]|nr:DsbA family protein [Paracoccaceae bacterium]
MKRRFFIGAGAVAIAGGGVYWLNASDTALGSSSSAGFGAAMAQSSDGQTAEEIDTSGVAEMALGNADAPVTVIEYGSLTCPHCARFHKEVLPKIKENYIDTGKVRFIFREAYFDRFGLWASLLARCGGEMRFFGIVDILYADQHGWLGDGEPGTIVNNLRKIGLTSGLTNEQLDTCFNDEDNVKTLVAWYQQNFTRDNMDSTPSFLIQGEKYSNMSYENFAKILDDKLSQ